jgi:hypothetical protein
MQRVGFAFSIRALVPSMYGTISKYYDDAYDKEKNIVVEYDEKKHYDDVENNILREKDLKRQKEIIEHLHCEFWRYNETTKCLWKVQIN